ncbi:MAG: DUF554 domain-containing protein [Chloroflexi bacterium]|nr:DUF554 domain-containing protein [Chloroflexota bacterium]
MFLSGTLLNAATVLIGGLLGTLLGDRLPERLRENLVNGVGLFTIVMGVKFSLQTGNLLILLGSVLLGGAIGTQAGIERRLGDLGAQLQRRLGRGEGTVAEGLVTATIVFCVGPLTFLGSIQNGLSGDATLLTIKSVLDGFTAIALAATLGWGVLLAIPVILVYQGSLAAGAATFSGLLSSDQLSEMNAVGGLLILGVGLRLLRIRDVAVADFLPAILVAPFLLQAVTIFKEALAR